MGQNFVLVLQIIALAEQETPGIVDALKTAMASGQTMDQMITTAKSTNAGIEAKAQAEIKADTPQS